MQAIQQGYEVMAQHLGGRIGEWELEPADGKHRLFMIGNDAIALGALAAGVRFMAAYPITPATNIMVYMIKRFEVTEDGVSPRVIPGMKNDIHHVTGVEHDETGKPSEAASNRQLQMDKRMRKF